MFLKCQPSSDVKPQAVEDGQIPDSMSAAFLSQVLSYLSAYGERDKQSGLRGDPSVATHASHPVASFFSLMASAGKGLSRPEPWLEESSSAAPPQDGGRSQSGATSKVAPIAPLPGTPWSPSWTPASSADDPRWSSGHASHPMPEGAYTAPSDSAPSISCPKPCLSADEAADVGATGSPVSLLDASPALMTPKPSPGGAPCSEPSMMDIDDDGTPSSSRPLPGRGGGGFTPVDGTLGTAQSIPPPSSSADPSGSSDLESWHQSVVLGMSGWKKKLDLGMSSSSSYLGRR